MRRAYQSILTVGSAALILAGTAVAGPPTPYDDWRVSAGVITSPAGAPLPCPTGFTCGAPLIGDGFLQRTLTQNIPGGAVQYFQTIITNQGATAANPANLDFSDESFVRSSTGGQAASGIADRQRINDIPQNLTTTNELNMGWANTGGTPELNLSQTLTEPATNFSTDFNFQSNNAGADRKMTIGQSVSLQQTGQPGSAGDVQGFKLVQVGGNTFVPAAGSATTQDGQTVNWTAGQTVQAIWVGQDMTGSTSQLFGFQSFANLSASPVVTNSYFDLSTTGVGPTNNYLWQWPDPPFGTAPSF